MNNKPRKVYVDTNVLVNYFTSQVNDVQCLDYIFQKRRKDILFTSSLAKVQMASILQTKKNNRHKFTRAEIAECNEKINHKFSIIDLTDDDIQNGVVENNEDVEDNVHYILADKLKCNIIITNNTSDFYCFRGKMTALTPKDMKSIKEAIR